MNSDYISASEVGNFVYCPKCWWDQVRGLVPETPAMRQGTAHHEGVFNLLQLKSKLLKIILVFIGLSTLIIALILIFKTLWR
jgi:hypothetical protein